MDASSPPCAAVDPDATVPSPTPLDLFWGFMRIAILSFGGVLPWARFVLVERRRWLSAQDFTDMLALCQLLPGPNIVNMSVAIGARFHGAWGSVCAISGLVGLPVVIVLLLVTLYSRFESVPAVARALDAMAAAAAGLVIAMALKMAVPLLKARFAASAPILVLTFVAVAILQFPLMPVVLVLAPLAIWAHGRRR